MTLINIICLYVSIFPQDDVDGLVGGSLEMAGRGDEDAFQWLMATQQWGAPLPGPNTLSDLVTRLSHRRFATI